MTLSSRAIAALAVLFVMLGVAVVAADSIGVNTSVYLPDQPTPTSVPPTPTPVPVASADNWVAVGVNQYQYAGDIASTAQLSVTESVLENFIVTNGFDAPAEDDQYPLLTLLDQIRTGIDSEVETNQLNSGYVEAAGPLVELYGGVPVTTLHYRVLAHSTLSGEFPGADLFFAWLQRGDDLVQIEYQFSGAPDDTILADMKAWLDENVPEFAQVAEEAQPDAEPEAEADADAEAESDAEPEADVEPEAVTEADADAEAEAESDAEAEADVEPETDADAEPEANAEADVEADADTEADTEADAETDAEPEADAEAESEPEADADATTDPAADAASGPWYMIQEGYYLHTDEPNAFIGTGLTTLSTLAEQVSYVAEDDEELTVETLLAFIAESNDAQLNAEDSEVTIVESEGPATREINGVTVHYLRYVLEAENEGTTVKQVSFQGLIDLGDENISIMTFQYGYEDEANPTISGDFDQWLEDNIDTLSAAE